MSPSAKPLRSCDPELVAELRVEADEDEALTPMITALLRLQASAPAKLKAARAAVARLAHAASPTSRPSAPESPRPAPTCGRGCGRPRRRCASFEQECLLITSGVLR